MRVPLVVLFLAILVAGCFGPAVELTPVATERGVFWMDLPVHVVAVGWEDFDAAALERHLHQPQYMYGLLRGDVTGDISPEALQYRVDYRAHEAPTAFASELFAFAETTIDEAPLPAYLRSYDLAGEQRACTPATVPLVTSATCEDVRRVDAEALESWIADNRAAHGLDFEAPGYTIYLLDSYTLGHLPKDRYHQYRIDDGTSELYTKDQRAWGGSHDFVFMDLGAAPNDWDHKPWLNWSREGAKLWEEVDEPVWDHVSKSALYGDLGRNVVDATRMLWARMPIYPFEYAEKYVLPMYVIIDAEAHTHPDSPLNKIRPADVEAQTDAAVIEKAFADLVPWAEVELHLEFVYLPDDDPALAAALKDAKTRGDGSYVDFGILKKYFHEQWAEYVPEEPGVRVYPTFAFWLGAPSQGLYAYSDSDHLGRSWGVFVNAADLFICGRPTQPVCFTEDLFSEPKNWWAWWNAVLVHELGHSFGLTHPHDTGGLDADGYTTYEINWLWDSTSSVMTYRHAIPEFNQFDKDLVLRGNAVGLAMRILETETTRASAVRADAEQVLALVQSGAYAEALELAAATAKAAGIPLIHDEEAALGTPGEPQRFRIEPVASSYVVPTPPLPFAWLRYAAYLPDQEGVTHADFPVELPEGTTALRIEYREDEGSSSRTGWWAFVTLQDTEGEYVSMLWNNGYDAAVLKAVDRCSEGCTGTVWVLTGAGTAYDVTLTPYTQ